MINNGLEYIKNMQQPNEPEENQNELEQTPSGQSENTMGLQFNQLVDNPQHKSRKSVASSNRRRKKNKSNSSTPLLQNEKQLPKNSETPGHMVDIFESSTKFQNARPSEKVFNKHQNKLITTIVDEPQISQEDKIYFELNYLIESIEKKMDTEECYFFDQLEVIRDRFKVVDK